MYGEVIYGETDGGSVITFDIVTNTPDVNIVIDTPPKINIVIDTPPKINIKEE